LISKMEIANALIFADSELDDSPWPSAPSTPRHLFPVANRPILFHSLERLSASGILEARILAESRTVRLISDAIGGSPSFGMRIGYDEWRPEVGLHGALQNGRAFVRNEPLLVARGDAVLHENMGGFISTFAQEGIDAMALRLGDVSAYPVPAYLFSPRAIAILLRAPESVTCPIERVAADGGRVLIHDVEGVLSCHGGQAALLASNRAILERLTPSISLEGVERSQIQGPVVIHPTASVSRSTLRGPLIIGAGAQVSDSYVGPYSSIGDNVILDGIEIEHSIVLPEAELRFIGTRLESSVIGRRARVARSFQPPGALRLSLGEGSEVVLG
jgi:glucose-1-phosphate thymidylyltransferase